MAAAVVLGTTLNSGANNDVYTTASFTPAANDLLYVTVAINGTALTPTVTGSTGLTFTNIASQTSATVSDVYTYIADALAANSSQTVSADVTGDTGTGCFISVLRVSGMTRTGVSAKKQSKTAAGAAGGTPAATFDASALTGNAVIAVAANISNPAAVTEPSTFTERSDTGHTLPDMGLETASVDSGFTGTTVTWGSTSATDWSVIIAELDTSAVSSNAVGRGLTMSHKFSKRSLYG